MRKVHPCLPEHYLRSLLVNYYLTLKKEGVSCEKKRQERMDLLVESVCKLPADKASELLQVLKGFTDGATNN